MRLTTVVSLALVASSALSGPLPHVHHRHRHAYHKRDVVTYVDSANAVVVTNQVIVTADVTVDPTTAAAAVATSEAKDTLAVVSSKQQAVSSAAVQQTTKAQTTAAAGTTQQAQTTAAAGTTQQAQTTAAAVSSAKQTTSGTTQETAAATSAMAEIVTQKAETFASASLTQQTTLSAAASADSSSTASSSASISGVPETITYSPYNADSSCKDAASVLSDLTTISGKGIKSVRIYATDCNSISTVQPACVSLGLTIDQGFWIGSTGADAIDDGVQDIIDWVANTNNNDWSIFTTFTVGNEAIYGGYIDASTLLAKIKSVKATLKAAGYTGTVTTAEPPTTYLANTDLCTDTDGMDYVGINAHPYFDASASPATAGDFVLSQISAVQSACNGRTVSITETGYPSAGNTNGLNVPTKANQAIAIANIMSALNNKGVMFTPYDDMWKQPGAYNVEQHFGILDLF